MLFALKVKLNFANIHELNMTKNRVFRLCSFSISLCCTCMVHLSLLKITE
uniref:Uncharacterized protein n=1 Tax=Anguilla anguilla TaxID=7936 RepID=A0A0E9Q379_ANGAN